MQKDEETMTDGDKMIMDWAKRTQDVDTTTMGGVLAIKEGKR